MTLALYMDHNVVQAVVDGCRSEGLDVLTALEDGKHESSDVEILERAEVLKRVVFTQDTDFLVLAAEFRSTGRSFSGVIFGKHGKVSIRKSIDDLKLICLTLSPDEFSGQIIWLPL
jgi:predicted nuclease of predicted toxin-antitoxin system